MDIQKKEILTKSIKFSVVENGQEVGRAFLCILKNDIHDKPFGLMEDVFIFEKFRGQGIGTKLVKKVIEEAKNRDCYKLIATSRNSRPLVHDLYLKIGFDDWGKEFRIDFDN